MNGAENRVLYRARRWSTPLPWKITHDQRDPHCTDKRILELRELHEEIDRAVLRAYPKLPGVGRDDPNTKGWDDIQVPPFCNATEQDRAALQAFEDEIIDRLFVLNELRAKEEAALGRGAKQKAAPAAAPTAATAAAAPKPRAKKATKKTNKNQGELF